VDAVGSMGDALRWFNELPLVLFIGVVWLVLAKPF
jgi:putative membrane protein